MFPPGHRNHGLTVLDRLASRRSHTTPGVADALTDYWEHVAREAFLVATSTGDPIGRLLAGELESRGDEEFLGWLVEECNDLGLQNSVWLREVAYVATHRLLKILEARPPEPADRIDWMDRVGSLSVNLSARSHDLGHLEEALERSESAVGIFRELAQQDPGLFRASLAFALNNHATSLRYFGDLEAALSSAEEAVDIMRQVVRAEDWVCEAGSTSDGSPLRPPSLPTLAGMVRNLGSFRTDLRQFEAALEAYEEASAVWRRLAKEGSPEAEGELATTRQAQGMLYAELQRFDEATVALGEAASLLETLALERFDAYGHTLAEALDQLALVARSRGRHDLAQETSRRAVTTYRRLAEVRPASFASELARALLHQGLQLQSTNPTDAVASTKEAIERFRELEASHPRAFRRQLAASLSNLSTQLEPLGLWDESDAAANESLALLRDLMGDRQAGDQQAEAEPAAAPLELAQVLANRSQQLRHRGDFEGARELANEALTLYRRLVEESEEAHLPGLATTLTTWANAMGRAGAHDEALDAHRQAIRTFRRLAKANPDVYEADLAMSLTNSATTLRALGSTQSALRDGIEALSLRRKLFGHDPERYRGALARSLTGQSLTLQSAGRLAEAVDFAAEAVGLHRSSAGDAAGLASSLNALGSAFLLDGRPGEAEAAFREARNRYTELSATDVEPARSAGLDIYRADLAAILANLSDCARHLGRMDEAVDLAREGIVTLRPFFLERPPAWKLQMLRVFRKYLDATAAAGREPEREVVEPLAPAFAQLGIVSSNRDAEGLE